jgi:hypothetical protein
LDDEVSTEESVLLFRLCLRRLSEEEVSGIEEKDPSPLFSELGNKGRFLGETAKRVPKSAAGLDLAHHIIRINDRELNLGSTLNKRRIEKQAKGGNQKKDYFF